MPDPDASEPKRSLEPSKSSRSSSGPAPAAQEWLRFPVATSGIRPPLTSTQKQVLDFIRTYRAQRGVSPTLQEIGDRFKTHRVTVHAHVKTLIRKGFLVRFSQKASRSLILVEELAEAAPSETASAEARPETPPSGRTPLLLPLAGRIAAGRPIEAAFENETLDIAALFPSERDLFVLEVSGDSMIDEQIRNGDFVVVEKRSTARNGEIVVAVLPSAIGGSGEATLKRFYREGARIRLQPANAAMSPTYFDRSSGLEIRGVVVGIVRRYR